MMTTRAVNTMFKGLLSFAKLSPYKTGIIVVVVLSLTATIYYSGKSAGYNKAKAQELKAVKAAEKVLRAEYDGIITRNNRERKAALRLIERLRNRPEVTHNEIKKAAAASTCKHLGLEFNRVYNKLIGDPPSD